MPREYQNASGQIVLDYAKAIQESVFEQLRVVRDGQLRVVFNSDLKIASWEFCARRHEELIPRRLIIPQVSQLGAVVHKHQTAAQNASSGLSVQDLQNTCSSFVASARQLAKALEVPLVNDLGYTKRYVRCLQISEVVNSMKDLIDYGRETGTGPMDSLINFPRRTSASSALQQHRQSQQLEEQQPLLQNSNHNDQASALASNDIASVNNSTGPLLSSTTSAVTNVGILRQNPTNSWQENQMGTANSPYSNGNSVRIPSASSSNSVPPQPNPSSPFPSQTPSSSNNNLNPTSRSNPHPNSSQQGPTQPPQDAEPSDSPSSVQQILQEMMMSSQFNEVKGISGLNGANCLAGSNGMMGYGGMGGIGRAATASGIRAAMSNNATTMNGRIGMNQMSHDPMLLGHHQQHDMGSRLLGSLGATNNFSNLQFDWKTSP